MTDANEETQKTAAEESAATRDAARESRQARTKGKVVEYDDADKETKLAMDRIMDAIDRAPDSFEAIITYGNPPLKKLGEIGNEMIKVQGKFNAQVNVMASAMGKLETGLQGMNMEEFGKKAREAITGVLGTGVKAGKGGFGALKNLTGSLLGKTSKKSDDEKFIEEMQEALPEMLMEMIKLVKDIEETDKGIVQVMGEAEKLGLARIEATREISLYLGASKEVLRRYNEEYIPQAQKDFEESGDPEDELVLKNIQKRKEDFLDRITVLEGSRAASVIAAQQLRQILETMEDQRKKIQDIIYNSQNEWKAMLASAGIAGSSLKAAKTLEQANKFGDKMHESTMQMIEEAHQMTLNSKSRGTVDPAKLVEAAGRLQLLIEKENDARKNRLAQLEATATQLRGATDRLIEAADASNKARLLEASEQVEKEAKKKLEAKDASNDNETKPAPRRAQQPKP